LGINGISAVPPLMVKTTANPGADIQILQTLIDKLGTRAPLKLFDDADHSFHVLARSRRKDAEIRAEMLDAIATWVEALV